MEEQKNNKEVKMEAVKTEQKEFTVEELKKVANQLFEEGRYLKHKLDEANETIRMFNRLDYLFRVLEVANSGKAPFSQDFIEMCASEIETAMTPAKDKQEETQEESDIENN